MAGWTDGLTAEERGWSCAGVPLPCGRASCPACQRASGMTPGGLDMDAPDNEPQVVQRCAARSVDRYATGPSPFYPCKATPARVVYGYPFCSSHARQADRLLSGGNPRPASWRLA